MVGIVDNFDLKRAEFTAASDDLHHRLVDEWFHPANDVVLKLELARAAAPVREIDIADVHNTIGVWHQAQYEKFGVQKLNLSANKVVMDLAKPVEISEWFNTIGFDKRFAFSYSCSAGGDWQFKSVAGLKLNGDIVRGITAKGNEISFDTDKGRRDYGAGVSNYIRALFEPLMGCIPHH